MLLINKSNVYIVRCTGMALLFTFTFNPPPGRSYGCLSRSPHQHCLSSAVRSRSLCVRSFMLSIASCFSGSPVVSCPPGCLFLRSRMSSLALQGALQDVFFLQWCCVEWCGQTRRACVVLLLPTGALAFQRGSPLVVSHIRLSCVQCTKCTKCGGVSWSISFQMFVRVTVTDK